MDWYAISAEQADALPHVWQKGVSAMCGLLGLAWLDQKEPRELQLHSGRNAARTPVVNALDSATLIPPEFSSELRGAAVVVDEFCISHNPESTLKV